MGISYENQILWPVYITIENLNKKTWQSYKWLRTMILDSISITYEQSKDASNQDNDLKAKIYQMILKTML